MKKLQNNSFNLEEDINSLKREIQQLKDRNLDKDSIKAWENSLSRKIVIALLTYFVMVVLMGTIGVSEPFSNALVPTIGFVLSTLSLNVIRSVWLKNFTFKL